ncbi:spindle pole body component Spc98p [Trichomonascus vanleenenianus]|uniref:Spc98p n=1 Tax=Trichomonascus vanleenenianus TaxID=2268995 RepID=UPI003EC9BD0A
MSERKILDLLGRLVDQIVSPDLHPNDRTFLTESCYDLIAKDKESAQSRRSSDYSDLQHATSVILERMGQADATRLSGLVSWLNDLYGRGVLRKPGEVVSFLNLVSRSNEELMSERFKQLSLQKSPEGSYDEESEDINIGDIIRKLHEDQSPKDADLTHDVPYTLQGLRTANFKWVPQDGGYSLELPRTIPWPLVGLLNQLLEPALLYRHLRDVVDRPGPESLVKQSLMSSINTELQNYLALVGVIENQIRRNKSDTSITLRRCVILLQEATLGLRLLYAIAQGSETVSGGGPVLSLLNNYVYHGDEFVSEFAKRLLEAVSKPFYAMLNHWVTSGALVDPHNEFFVYIADPSSTWEGRFGCDMAKVPSYMSERVANEVFETGKTLYFIRSACDDTAWLDARRAATTKPIEDYEALQEVMTKGYAEVVEHLNRVLKEKFHLDLHLQALKDYLLLGKGDFVQVLVETAAPILEKPANRLLRHHLTSTLETAIRTSNAQYDSPEVLKSLDARMLELGHGDIGWDVFTLDYRVDRPLDVVLLNRQSMTEYLRVFNFLWRIKRVSYSLYTGWRKMATGARSGLLRGGEAEQWNMVRQVYQEMVHFINEMQYYINYEVVELAWTALKKDLEADGLTVDEIMASHRKYLEQITFKGLLGGEDALMGELHEILKRMLLFKDSVDGLFDVALRLRTVEDQSLVDRFNSICDYILTIKAQFEKNVTRLVYELSKQDDAEMRFLGVRLDFNGFYSSQ